MFYEPALANHALPFDPFKGIVAPRPIGWISTLDSEGRANLAPYSYFNAIGSRPPMVMFASEGEKDSVANIRQTGEFVANHVSMALAGAMNKSSAGVAHGIDEFALAGLEKAACRLVKPPRVALALAALECVATKIEAVTDRHGIPTGSILVIGEVIGVHVNEAALREGRFDPQLAMPVARMGYRQYLSLGGVFEMDRPKV